MFDGKPPEEVLRRVKARFLVISFASDWLYPPAQSRELVRWLKRCRVAATYINLETLYGHDSFLIENPEFAQVVRHYLEHEYRKADLKEAGAADLAQPCIPEFTKAFWTGYPKALACWTWGRATAHSWSGSSQARRVMAEGVEINPELVARCIQRGLVVHQGNIAEGLDQYGDQSFDYVLLLGTFQELVSPR